MDPRWDLLLRRLTLHDYYRFKPEAPITGVCLARNAQIVDRWAENLGSELWELANAVARPDELKLKYKLMNARVEDKSGEELIDIISESVGRMLRRKMDAVRCILKVAEDAAEEWNSTAASHNITYVSGKYSPVMDQDPPVIPSNMRKNASVYREIELNPDSHFYNIPVNTNYSSVHIPTNVYDLLPSVKDAIKWSEALNDVFRQNYRSDPALSWQYFGSMTGILRQYPAMQWRTTQNYDTNAPDLYDCRIRSWYIEAATCSKDMIILVDSSGSMTGMGYTIAKAVVNSILDTLSNNDFVTILHYTNDTDYVVPCFEDKLIQATPENLNTFREYMKELDPLENANLTKAFTQAFEILKTYRETRGCGPETPCNQLIMLVTDGVASNISEVFDAWNRYDNGTRIPVRVFTYLLGKEVTKVREIQLMACENRGYYTHVHTQEEAQEQVVKYIPVVARPLVLQGYHHPVVWTHAYTDVSRAKGEDPRLDAGVFNNTLWQEYRLLTSVSIPVFDRKGNRNNASKQANLLGVVGTDVPIESIQKLTLPFKLGVNGYAFIVSNNGYVILHPDLRPVSEGRLKLNYNSVDLSEVEILDDGRKPRDPGPEVLKLRQALVDHQYGSMKDVPVKFHYDDNRRVMLEKRDYYYAPLPGTPFGIAVAIPNYGKTWIKVTSEIEKNRQAGINISDFFASDRWRVHPGWVYCRYHYLEGHEFPNSEAELRYFLWRLEQPGWKWSDQYTAYDISMEEEEEPDCGRQVLEDDDYYCNEELVQLLVFDAKATNQSYGGDFNYKDEYSKNLAELYKVYLRYVATQSGLTRWQYIESDYLEETKGPLEFGDLHRRAVNEPWYKGAIFQHQINPNSILLTVPWNAGPDATVTASMAIFPRDGGKNASAAVVGFQMPMTAFYQRFINITSVTSNPDMDCSHVWIDCYLIDQNGFVVVSEAHNDTGQFLGAVEGAVMKSMVVQGFFEAVDIYDYQGLCKEIGLEGAASFLTNPLSNIFNLITWLFVRTLWIMSQFVNIPETFARVHSDEDLPEKPKPPHEVEITYACDLKRTLYIMNQTMAVNQITNSPVQCSRPFFAQLVPNTNLLLVVVDTLFPTCYERLEVLPVQIDPSEYTNDTEPAPCHKKKLNDLPRRRLEKCFTEHPEEDEIDQCGRGTRLHNSIHINILLLFILVALKIIL
ncbi:voltage-dependent calcium channel subunit alpha-2/delta-3 isoform X3 [Microplitis mediator]|uniref:voltage-dependent calcium channel subunit alpha-2/delta-3 isoform X3 n=1 Tax=Microplitis mediator TaxID=375433 RepID=UPI002553EB1E|nr:voltage-dependent calcium channel subunit alpha-2/delta-3 isoform X3 [Microplitis mediator]